MKTILQLCIALVAVTSLTGCLPTKKVEIHSVSDIEIIDLGDQAMDFSFVADIENPNSVNLTAKDADIEVFIENQSLGQATLVEEITLPRNSRQSTKVRCKLAMKDPIESYLGNLLFSLVKGKIELRFKGEIRAQAIIFTHALPVDETIEVPLSEFDL